MSLSDTLGPQLTRPCMGRMTRSPGDDAVTAPSRIVRLSDVSHFARYEREEAPRSRGRR
jgi:hypothetical protein